MMQQRDGRPGPERPLRGADGALLQSGAGAERQDHRRPQAGRF